MLSAELGHERDPPLIPSSERTRHCHQLHLLKEITIRPIMIFRSQSCDSNERICYCHIKVVKLPPFLLPEFSFKNLRNTVVESKDLCFFYFNLVFPSREAVLYVIIGYDSNDLEKNSGYKYNQSIKECYQSID